MSLETVLSMVGIALTVIAGAWALMKVVASQFNASLDQRFAAQEKIRDLARIAQEARLERLEQAEREFRQFNAEVHRDFVRREDHTRELASIKVMIDNLALNIERSFREIWQDVREKKA